MQTFLRRSRSSYADSDTDAAVVFPNRFPILYVTVRDQLLSPLVQGAVWGFGGLLLTQFRQYMSARAQSSASTGTRGSYKSNASILKSLGISKR